jgi:predicted regulator of Ras-like GTPase activity (Roadblock/LC7/MglB family)
LQQLRQKSPEVTATVLATADGFPVHSDAAGGVDVDSLAATAADLAARTARMAEDLGQGSLQQILAQADGGYILASRISDEMTLAVIAKTEASLGLLLINVRKAAAQLAQQV